MASVLFTGAAERARQTLSRSTIYVLRKIEVECDTDAIVLRGSVDSFYHKQLAQELVCRPWMAWKWSICWKWTTRGT